MALERLQKIIARAGIASRRGAEQLIEEGQVSVNGKVVTELGTKADIDVDHVKVRGKLVTREEARRYILLYKPRQVMTTLDDPSDRPTVLDFVKGVRERVFPVGRLDYNSEGLILLTNDGDLAFRIAHPKHGSVKTYHVKVRGVPTDRLTEKLARGITIEGKRTLPCEISRIRTTGRGEDEGNSWFEVKLREGRTQQIRKMYKTIGHPVMKLRRVAIGPLADSTLEAGQWRDLSEQEVRRLRSQEEPRPSRRKPKTPAATADRSRAPRHAAAKKPAAKRTAAPRKKESASRSRSRSS
jgi:pseudouridine synthase